MVSKNVPNTTFQKSVLNYYLIEWINSLDDVPLTVLVLRGGLHHSLDDVPLTVLVLRGGLHHSLDDVPLTV